MPKNCINEKRVCHLQAQIDHRERHKVSNSRNTEAHRSGFDRAVFHFHINSESVSEAIYSIHFLMYSYLLYVVCTLKMLRKCHSGISSLCVRMHHARTFFLLVYSSKFAHSALATVCIVFSIRSTIKLFYFYLIHKILAIFFLTATHKVARFSHTHTVFTPQLYTKLH